MTPSRTFESPRQKVISKSQVDPETGCWIWQGHKNGDGYGRMIIGGRSIPVTHVSVREFQGAEVPKGLCVCHKCDNPSCVNPDHLWVGTHGDNARDKIAKGRYRGLRGEENPRAKLTAERVLAIRADRAAGMTYAAIAEKHGIRADQAFMVGAGRTWRHVPMIGEGAQ